MSQENAVDAGLRRAGVSSDLLLQLLETEKLPSGSKMVTSHRLRTDVLQFEEEDRLHAFGLAGTVPTIRAHCGSEAWPAEVHRRLVARPGEESSPEGGIQWQTEQLLLSCSLVWKRERYYRIIYILFTV